MQKFKNIYLTPHSSKTDDDHDFVRSHPMGDSGRNWFLINVRLPRELRQNVERLKQIPVPLPKSSKGSGSSGMPSSSLGTSFTIPEGLPSVALRQIADIRVTSGPPMIKDESGMLVGYVYVDMDLNQRDVGSYVEEAKKDVFPWI